MLSEEVQKCVDVKLAAQLRHQSMPLRHARSLTGKGLVVVVVVVVAVVVAAAAVAAAGAAAAAAAAAIINTITIIAIISIIVVIDRSVNAKTQMHNQMQLPGYSYIYPHRFFCCHLIQLSAGLQNAFQTSLAASYNGT